MAFLQDAPQLPHPFGSDRVLRGLLDRIVSAERRAALHADLQALGDYALHAWHRASESVRRKPALTTWDAWGQRIDAGTLRNIRLRAAKCVPGDMVQKRQHRSLLAARKPHAHRRLVSG